MEGLAVTSGVVDGLEVDGVFKKPALGNLLGDFRQNLEHHAAGADIGMTDLGVAHLPGRQTDVQAGGLQLGVGVSGKKGVQVWFLRLGDGIARCGRGNAVAVHDDENCAVFNLGLHTVQP